MSWHDVRRSLMVGWSLLLTAGIIMLMLQQADMYQTQEAQTRLLIAHANHLAKHDKKINLQEKTVVRLAIDYMQRHGQSCDSDECDYQ